MESGTLSPHRPLLPVSDRAPRLHETLDPATITPTREDPPSLQVSSRHTYPSTSPSTKLPIEESRLTLCSDRLLDFSNLRGQCLMPQKPGRYSRLLQHWRQVGSPRPPTPGLIR